MVKRDIRHLLLRQMEDWRGEKFVFDARRYARPRHEFSEDDTIAVFTRLLLHGQVHFAVCFITDRVSDGWVLAYDDFPSGVPGKSVANALGEKQAP